MDVDSSLLWASLGGRRVPPTNLCCSLCCARAVPVFRLRQDVLVSHPFRRETSQKPREKKERNSVRVSAFNPSLFSFLRKKKAGAKTKGGKQQQQHSIFVVVVFPIFQCTNLSDNNRKKTNGRRFKSNKKREKYNQDELNYQQNKNLV